MAFSVREFRILPRGSAGRAGDDDGVAIGPFPLVKMVADGCCSQLARVAPDDEIQKALTLAYGQVCVSRRARITRALHSIAKTLTEGKYALAQIMAVQMGLPEFSNQVLVGLDAAAELLKDYPNWPSEAHDVHGRWTDSGEASGAIVPVIEPYSPECLQAINEAIEICTKRYEADVIPQGRGAISFFSFRRCVRSPVPSDCGY
ncbi:MAG: hypothetical protein ACREEL_04400 [Stellaceae bacterium]